MSRSTRNNKRKAADSEPPAAKEPRPEAAAASQPRPSRAAAHGSLNEELLAAGAGMSPLEQRNLAQVENFSFWSQFATELIVQWIIDYPQGKKLRFNREDRDAVLKAASTHSWVARPREKNELAELQALYIRRVPEEKRGALLPGRFVPPAVPALPANSVAASSSSAAASGTPPPAASTPVTPARPFNAKESAAIVSPAGRARAMDYMHVPGLDEEEKGDADDNGAHGHSAQYSFDLAEIPTQCPHCLLPCNNNRLIKFQCERCHRRSDLEFNDPRQAQLIAQFGQLAPAAAASSSATTTSGQSSDTTPRVDSLLAGADKLLEQEFLRMQRDHPVSPLFGLGPNDPLTPAGAIALNGKAYRAPAFKRLSPVLYELIRTGRLTNPAYGIPRPINDASGAGSALVTLDGAGLSVKQRAAPRIENLLQLNQALFCTILPALATDPTGITQWITLIRSALAIYETSGSFQAAMQYIEQLLNERVFSQEGYCEVSVPVLQTVTMSAPRNLGAGGAGRPQHQQQPAGGEARSRIPGAKTQVCFDWNNNRPCSRTPCGFAHQCKRCGSSAHKEGACPQSAPSPASVPGSGSGKSRKGGGGGAPAASVKTAEEE